MAQPLRLQLLGPALLLVFVLALAQAASDCDKPRSDATWCSSDDFDDVEPPADDVSLLQVGLEHRGGVSVSSTAAAATRKKTRATSFKEASSSEVLAHGASKAERTCFGSGVLITGATSPLGKILYKMLKERGMCVRAVVLSQARAREELECEKCDESEGIYVGNVTSESSIPVLTEAAQGTTSLVILASSTSESADGSGSIASYVYPDGNYPVDVDFRGTINTVRAFKEASPGLPKHVLRASVMGTTREGNPIDKVGNGYHGFFHLQSEAFLMSCGLPFTVIKACMLDDTPGGQRELVVGHRDLLLDVLPTRASAEEMILSRSDVARLFLEALLQPKLAENVRTDLCSVPGPATTDFAKLLQRARDDPW